MCSYLRLFGHEQFAFDPAGNRLDGLSGSHTEKTTTLNRVWGNLLKNWLGKHYEYDQRGNLLAKSENGKQETFRWNSYNRLIQYTKDNQTTEYKYDPFGRRIAKIHNGTTTLYHWDGDVLAAESNANSTTHYIFEPDTFEPVAQFVSAPLRPQTPLTFRDYTYYTPEIDPLNQEPTPQEYLPDSLAYFHLDHLGTPIEMTDRAGKTVWEATYQAWGEVEMVSGSLKQPFRFQGQYFDEESGLHYNRFRYYDPSSGRFVSQDPIGLLGGFNLYEYAPNPIGWVDPFGLNRFKPTTWKPTTQGCTGYQYKVYQQPIDWDLKVNTRDGVKTNLELAEMGRSPFVVKNGQYSLVNLHHSKQNAKGPLFELSSATHQKYYGSNALHPYLPKSHPMNPVPPVRANFNVDKEEYWISRAKAERARRNNPKTSKC